MLKEKLFFTEETIAGINMDFSGDGSIDEYEFDMGAAGRAPMVVPPGCQGSQGAAQSP